MAKAPKKPRKQPGRRKRRIAVADIPRKDTVVGTDSLTMPGGARFTILKTDQVDPYDPQPRRCRRRR